MTLEIKRIPVLGTELAVTSYENLSNLLLQRASDVGCFAIDFSNTHIITMRRHVRGFLDMTNCMDLFVPDAVPLVWVMNAKGAGMRDRVYGPTFLRECVRLSPSNVRHYFLGGDQSCLNALLINLKQVNPELMICGSHHGYFGLDQEEEVWRSINQAKPDLLWVGLGTPKQQEWINRWKPRFNSGVLLAVGFAFDVNAGMKSDAPAWMQRAGMTWLYRMGSEPRRLIGRYLKWNSLFIWYLLSETMGRKSGHVKLI